MQSELVIKRRLTSAATLSHKLAQLVIEALEIGTTFADVKKCLDDTLDVVIEEEEPIEIVPDEIVPDEECFDV